ncbi:methyltransferase [Micromonospora sp. NPDC053740]|uniref:methyltransferase n=1 Tax=Micromonospora TaxID=1873 RepID=UPI001EE82652|nr:methyltransferase [Micromonospora alfalfae]MCG5465347.1 COMT family class I SAM-dependent methyltransferase [Micromonospora alfalfae]
MTENRVNLYSLTDTITPWAVRAAATLGLADLIAAGTTTLDELAAATKANPDALHRLLRYLSVRGVFTETEPRVYALTEAAEFLKTDHPAAQRPWLDVDSMAGRIEGTFSSLTHSIRTGDAAYPVRYGIEFWDDLATNPDRATSFGALMATHASYFDQVVQGYDWSTVNHVIDVGGGTGALLTEILKAQPHLRGTVVDLAGVVEQGRARFEAAGIADRAEVVSGSIFDPLPAGADVYILSNVLHDWNDSAAEKILQRAADAIGTTGKVLIVQILVKDENDNFPDDPARLMFITQMDLRLLSLMAGKARTWREYAELGEKAGLQVDGSTVIPTGQTLLSLRRG